MKIFHVPNTRSVRIIWLFEELQLPYELEVLKGIDFTKQTINYILIEVYEKDRNAILSFMEDKGYVLIGNISNFTKETHPNWDGTHNDYLFKIK